MSGMKDSLQTILTMARTFSKAPVIHNSIRKKILSRHVNQPTAAQLLSNPTASCSSKYRVKSMKVSGQTILTMARTFSKARPP
jgi:hypothetical protein